jgi:signal transduction histidine kinase
MGVEGGMYMLNSGIQKKNEKRIAEGWEVLSRNIPKVSSLVKDFLSFAKGRVPNVQLIDPNSLIEEILNLYQETAKKLGIDLVWENKSSIPFAMLDPSGIHTCLTNLISNAMDACSLSNKAEKQVTLEVRDTNNVLIFEVRDNGAGMDYEVKQKVFTTFFTTKGGQGTGLGLLTTRKIVQEHGGKILVESEEGKGSTFKMEFPRNRLPQRNPTELNNGK